MKKTTVLLFVSICLMGFINNTTAQSKEQDKAEREELRKFSKMKPEEVKELKLRLDRKVREVEECESVRLEMKQQIAEKDDEITKLKDNLIAKGTSEAATPTPVVVAEPTKTTAATPQNAGSGTNVADASGVHFRVQISAERNKIPDFITQELYTEENNGMQKLLKGVFYDINEADAVRKYFVRLGIRDAWVVCYNGNQRISRREAMQQLKSN